MSCKTKGSDKKSQVAAKKPTKFMTNSRALGHELSRRCNGKHQHQSLVDGRAQFAARYPTGLCKAICRSIIKLKREKHEAVRIVARIEGDIKRRVLDPEELHERSEVEIQLHCLNKLACHKNPKCEIVSALAWDDLTGMRLDAGKVIEARAKEVQYIMDKRVCSKITRKKTRPRAGKSSRPGG